MERREDGLKVSQDDTAIESDFVPSVALTSQLFAALGKFVASFTELKFSENIGIECSGGLCVVDMNGNQPLAFVSNSQHRYRRHYC